MRFKADENISDRVIRLLRERRHDVVTVAEEKLVGASDTRVAAAARSRVKISGKEPEDVNYP